MQHKDDKIPEFSFSGDTITISGSSIMEDPFQEWSKFITNLRIYIDGRKEITINFELDLINSSNSLYIINVFSVLNEHRRNCKITVNWYYYEADEDMEFLGETYQERNPRLNFNLKLR